MVDHDIDRRGGTDAVEVGEPEGGRTWTRRFHFRPAIVRCHAHSLIAPGRLARCSPTGCADARHRAELYEPDGPCDHSQ